MDNVVMKKSYFGWHENKGHDIFKSALFQE